MVKVARWVLFLSFFAFSLASTADTLRIATWNLGWHVSGEELPRWTAQCGKRFFKGTSGVWNLAPQNAPNAKLGWEITEPRATLEGVDTAVMPPCAVYVASGNGIAVTEAAYKNRVSRLATLLSTQVRADVIAFQEVSGTMAVLEALGPLASEYNACSFDGAYRVQRLAFAWKKIHGPAAEACADIKEISLPAAAAADRVRPGYTVTLNLAGRRVRFMTVHMKSSCVSSLEGAVLDEMGAANNPCRILQQQVEPLEDAFERLSIGVDHFVLLGDFNRNLWHEFHTVKGAEAVRSDNSTDLASPKQGGVRTRNMLYGLNDGSPPASVAELLSSSCVGSPNLAAACEASKTGVLTAAQRSVLTGSNGLGCRNPVGLDFMIVSKSLVPLVRSVVKVPLGDAGRTRLPVPPAHPVPQLSVSDHCPLVTVIDL